MDKLKNPVPLSQPLSQMYRVTPGLNRVTLVVVAACVFVSLQVRPDTRCMNLKTDFKSNNFRTLTRVLPLPEYAQSSKEFYLAKQSGLTAKSILLLRSGREATE